MLSTLAMGTLNQQMDGATLDSKELFFLSTAIKNLASAEKTAVDRELMLRKEIVRCWKSSTRADYRPTPPPRSERR